MSKTKKDKINRQYDREFEDRAKKKQEHTEHLIEKRMRNAMRSNNVRDIMNLEYEYY